MLDDFSIFPSHATQASDDHHYPLALKEGGGGKKCKVQFPKISTPPSKAAHMDLKGGRSIMNYSKGTWEK